MNRTNNIEEIKNELIKSCIYYDSKTFIPFLLSKNVQTGMPNKIRFYQFFKYMINCTKDSSVGQLTLKIEQDEYNNNQRNYYLNFYDNIHKHSRLSIEVQETKENIYFDTFPF